MKSVLSRRDVAEIGLSLQSNQNNGVGLGRQREELEKLDRDSLKGLKSILSPCNFPRSFDSKNLSTELFLKQSTTLYTNCLLEQGLNLWSQYLHPDPPVYLLLKIK